jgi:hypothetical protein
MGSRAPTYGDDSSSLADNARDFGQQSRQPLTAVDAFRYTGPRPAVTGLGWRLQRMFVGVTGAFVIGSVVAGDFPQVVERV